MDLATCSGVEAMAWLHESFRWGTLSQDPVHRPADVFTYIRAGLTDTDLILSLQRKGSKRDRYKVWVACPEGSISNDDDHTLLALIGPTAYLDDPDSHDEWAAVARRVNVLDNAEVPRKGPRQTRDRREPNGEHRYHYFGWQACEAFIAAGRGPTYARRIVEIAERHDFPDIDAFGFDIDPAGFADMLEAGVRNDADLSAYLAAGLTISEALVYRTDGIPPAAILKAEAEGYDKAQWPEVLHGLPADWFRDLGSHTYDDERERAEHGRLTHYLRRGGNDRYTLADLRYLVERGWSDKVGLSEQGLRLTDDVIAQTARLIADHGLTWTDMDRWAKAMAQGKRERDRHSTDHTTPPLLIGSSHARGYGTNNIRFMDLDRVLAVVDTGIKASHVANYRKAGCRSPEDIVTAVREGITPTRVATLLAMHGRKPSNYHSTLLIDSLGRLIKAHRDTPGDARQDEAETA